MPIYVPIDLRCNFCISTFCCKECRDKHENNEHKPEQERIYREELIQSICFLCQGKSFPININEKPPKLLIDHIIETHFPLKCDKCLKMFETKVDIDLIGKCCVKPAEPEPQIMQKEKKHVEIEPVPLIIPTPKVKMDFDYNEEDDLTPLTKINLHWRRKSKEFTLTVPENMERRKITRSTSTPVQMQNMTQDSTNSLLQFSSIRYNSSSDNDLSPQPTSQQQQPPIPTPIPSPKNNNNAKKSASQNRQKVQAQNTPLRQLMTKSIQKAIAAHGHYRNVDLQQRKVSFDSSTSSNEKTTSLLKFNESEGASQPLDLRTSPAIKRELFEGNKNAMGAISEELDAIGGSSNSNNAAGESGGTKVDFKYEEIRVIYQTDGSSIVTNYRSCYSESATPKVSSNNVLKKTISFESPATLEKTPACLLPRRAGKRSKSESDDDDDNEKDDTVFYTPKSTPVQKKQPPFRRLSSPLDSTSTPKEDKTTPSINIWKYMTSVVGSLVGGGGSKEKSEGSIDQTPPSSETLNWTSAFQKPLKAAAEYFTKTSSQSEDDYRAPKRRHSDDVKYDTVAAAALSPPIFKKRRIQGRKPIRRLQSDV